MRFAGTELGNYMSTPDFTGLGRTMMQGQSMQRNAANIAEGRVGIAGINADAAIKKAGYQASAIKAQGAAQGQASMASGIGNMFSGLAGGFARRPGGGGGGGGGGYGSFASNITGNGGFAEMFGSGNNWMG